MSDDNPFGDLRETAVESDNNDDPDDETTLDATTETGTASADSESTTDTADDQETNSSYDPESMPFFEFEQDQQRPVYVPDEDWEALDDAWEFDIRPELNQRRYKNISKRELHTALCRLGAREPEAVVAIIENARQEAAKDRE